MSIVGRVIDTAERVSLPDRITAKGIKLLVGRTRRRLAGADPDIDARFAAEMAAHAIAENTDAANRQHYEVPAAFFARVLGPRRKYSCCYYEHDGASLADAETAALERTMANADIADGQQILELGCGWGSLTLTMARRFPHARIVAVSNSKSQRRHIVEAAHRQGIANVEVITADLNGFATAKRFDRIVSVEMFEHMSNWRALLERVRGWLAPGGRLFVHVFSHRSAPYRFNADNDADWIARHFFTGGIMPSHGLMTQFGDLFEIEQSWNWNGRHYERTALDWLDNFDRHAVAIQPMLETVYGHDAVLWRRRWRLFFLATAGLFGHAEGTEWGVSHYRLRPA